MMACVNRSLYMSTDQNLTDRFIVQGRTLPCTLRPA